MAKQTFTTGQVLTAAQMTSLQDTAMGGGAASTKTTSYVLVAADAGTTVAMNAAGSTTITVNTGLFAAGDTVFIQNVGAGSTTITAGTATVNTAGSLVLPQYDAGILYFTSASAAIFYDYIQVGAASPLTTKGDLYTYSTSDTRLGVGTNGQVLQADSTAGTGLKWATASSGGFTLIATATPSAASTFSFTSIPYASYKHLMIVANELVWSATGNAVKMRFATGSYYSSRVMYMTSTPTYSCDAGGRGDAYFGASQNESCPIVKGYTSGGTFGDISSKSIIWIYDINNTSQDRLVEWRSFGQAIAAVGQGAYENSANLDTIEFATTAGTVTGTVKLYGVS